MINRLFIATAFVASLAMQAPVVAQTQEDVVSEIAPVEVPQTEQPKCSNCSNPLQSFLNGITLGFAVYNITHGAITLTNTVGPCIDECASNVAYDFGWGAFQLLSALL